MNVNLGIDSVIALDSILFIYLLDTSNSEFYSTTLNLFKKLESQKIKSLTSIISVIETLSSPLFINHFEKIDEYTRFFENMEGLTVYDVDDKIGFETARLRRENRSLRTPDAIQLATALVHKADIFITNDNNLKNLSLPDLKIVTLKSIS